LLLDDITHAKTGQKKSETTVSKPWEKRNVTLVIGSDLQKNSAGVVRGLALRPGEQVGGSVAGYAAAAVVAASQPNAVLFHADNILCVISVDAAAAVAADDKCGIGDERAGQSLPPPGTAQGNVSYGFYRQGWEALEGKV
jgi:hypothetical protein